MPLRPLAVLGFAAFAGSVIAVCVGPSGSMALAVLFGLLGLAAMGAGIFHAYSVYRKRTLPMAATAILAKAPAVAMACLAGSLVLCRYSLAWSEQVEPVQELDGVKAKVCMLILDYPEERYHRYYYQAKVISLDGERVEPFTIRLSCAEPIYCRPCEQFTDAQVVFYRFRSGGLYSSSNSQLAAGNVLGAYLAGYDTRSFLCIDPPVTRFTVNLRNWIGRGIARYLPEKEAGLVRAVLLGQRSILTEAVSGDFARIGASHLMAISGLHMTVLAALVMLFMRFLPVGIGFRNLLTGLFLFFYLSLIGFPSSAVRSGIMFLIFLLAQAIGRRADSLNSLGAAALVICLARPFAGGDLGLALSLGATAGIILLYRPLMRTLSRPLKSFAHLDWLLRPVCASLAVTFAVTIFTLPIQIEVFGGFSLLNPLANLLLVPLVSLLMCCAVPFGVLAAIPQTAMLARPFAFCAGWLARLILWIADKLASAPYSWIGVDHETWAAILAVSLLLCLLGLIYRGKQGKRLTAACMAVLIPLWFCWQAWQQQGAVTIAVVGEKGSACVLVMKDGHAAALSLGGYNSGMAETLLSAENIRTLNSVFLPVRDPQAREMAAGLLSSRPAERLLLPEGAYAGKDLEKTGVPITYLLPGEAWWALPGIMADFSPETGQICFTANGVRVIVETEGTASGSCDLLITGQAETAVASAYTLLFVESGQELGDIFSDSPMGTLVLIDEQTTLFARIDTDGRLRLTESG